MRFSPASLIRLLAGAALVLSTAAVGLSRIAPPPRGWRMPCPVRDVNVNTFFLDPGRRGSVWLDRDTGRTSPLPLPGNEVLEYASCSPWRDEQGHAQVVGRWSRPPAQDDGRTVFGLARLSVPDGAVLDHDPIEVIPVGPPCWYPGSLARVLFAGGDGKLYEYAFESSTEHPEGGAEGRLRPIAWNLDRPGRGEVFLSDPHWPSVAGFERLLLVSLQRSEVIDGRRARDPDEPWWLRLGDDGEVEAAGPLLGPDPATGRVERRFPVLGKSRDGRLILGFLRREGSEPWELHLATIGLDPESRTPRVALGPTEAVAGRCVATAPVFSSDGRSVRVVQVGRDGRRAIRRIGVDPGAEPGRSRSFASASTSGPSTAH